MNLSSLSSTVRPNTSDDDCPILQPYVDVFYIYVLGMGPIILMGFILNILNLIVLRRHGSKINSFFLLQFLAGADLLFMFVCFLYFPVRHLSVLAARGDEIFRRDDWRHGVDILKVVDPLFYVGQNLRNWTTVLISIERFVAIVFPDFAARFVNKRSLSVTFVLILIGSIINPIVSYFRMRIRDITNECTGEPDIIINYARLEAYSFRHYYIIVVIIIPVVLMWIVNVALIVILRRSIQRRSDVIGIKSQKDAILERQATAMVIGVLVVFTVCETPACVDHIIKVATNMKKGSYFEFFQYMRKIALFLNVLHSAINFFAYCISNPAFRRYFLDFLRRQENREDSVERENLSESDNEQTAEV